MWVYVISVILIILLCHRRRPCYYPPGPLCLPLVGHLLSVWWNLRRLKYHHAVWQNWSRKYGNILGLRLGGIYLVVISGRDLIKEVASREVFNGRPDGFFYTIRSFGKKLGIVFADGSSWYSTRRVVLKHLKNFGYGTRSMESMIAEESVQLVKLRMEDAGQPVLVNNMFDVAVLNILWRIVAGKRYDLRDDRLNSLCHLIKRAFKVVDMSGGIINFLPSLRHVVPGLMGYTELLDLHENLYQFIRETIKEHESSINLDCPRDVIDAFLIEMVKNKDNEFTEEELQVVCLDLLEAGMETVSNTVVFLLLHILLNKEVQQRLHQEIDDVLGPTKPPSLGDRTKMVYTEAVLLEALRISSVAPVGIPHMALEDAQLGSYLIPKGTFILLAMYDQHKGDHWQDPNIFRPERFLTKEGNLVQDDWLTPFGSGRRHCIGEGLARSELFLFTTHLLQKFHLHIPDGDPVPSTDPVNGVTLSAQPLRIVFQPRV